MYHYQVAMRECKAAFTSSSVNLSTSCTQQQHRQRASDAAGSAAKGRRRLDRVRVRPHSRKNCQRESDANGGPVEARPRDFNQAAACAQ